MMPAITAPHSETILPENSPAARARFTEARVTAAGSFLGDAAASAARSLRAMARADLERRLADVKAQAMRIGNFRPEDEIALARLNEEATTLQYRLSREPARDPLQAPAPEGRS